MSTRGTYTIKNNYYDDEQEERHFYIHYDNYPEGSAEYFKAFLNYENKRGGKVCQFLRANPLAEFTPDPDRHGDTEYHYTLEADYTLKAYEIRRDWKEGKNTTKEIFFNGNLAEFLNKYLEDNEEEYIFFKGEVCTTKQLSKKYDEEISNNWKWLYEGHIGNASFCLAWEIWKKLHPSTPDKTPKEILLASELLAKAYGWKDSTEFLNRVIKNLKAVKTN